MADKLVVYGVGAVTLLAFGAIVLALVGIAAPWWIARAVRRTARRLAAAVQPGSPVARNFVPVPH